MTTRRSDIVRRYIDWSNEGDLVSCDDLAIEFPDYTSAQIYDFLHHPKVVSKLEEYELPPPPRSKSARSLTDRQRRWLTICTNPYSTQSIKSLAETNGYTVEEHRRWMRQAHFKAEYTKLMRKEISGTEGELYRRTATKAMTGDPKALENLYRMQGRPLPSGLNEVKHGEISLDAVLQALQETLDSETLSRVAARLITGPQAELPSAE